VDVRRDEDVLLAREQLEQLPRVRPALRAALGGDGGVGDGLDAGFDERRHGWGL
jgi:hypothetical protein